MKFPKTENKIIINKSGNCEPSTAEIELNENNIPIKMTYKRRDFPELIEAYYPDITYYFTFTSQTQKLLKEVLY